MKSSNNYSNIALSTKFNRCILCLSFFIFSQNLSAQTINTVAGNYHFGTGYSGNGGPATDAELNYPEGIAADGNGNLFIADQNNNVIREVNHSTGDISTVAGNNTFGTGYSGDGGPATAAELYDPQDVAVDATGNIFIADLYNEVIREVNTSGVISTVAGNNAYGAGYSGDGGPATAAELDSPYGVFVDGSGNIYIADQINQVVREVNTSGVINTVAGNYAMGYGYSGDNGPATAAQLSYPQSVAVDGSGNIFIDDESNNVIREVNTSGIITTVAGNQAYGLGYYGDGGPATAAELNVPQGVGVDDGGDIYIADGNNQVIREVNLTTGIISTVVGDSHPGYNGDGGAATAAELYEPISVAWGGSNLFITDSYNNVIRGVTGIVVTGDANINNSGNFNCYPNPFQNMLYVACYFDSPQNIDIKLYNTLGQVVYEKKNSASINGNTLFTLNGLGDLPEGLYLVTVTGQNGKMFTGKVIK